MKRNRHNQSGQTLLEVLFAMVILLTALTATIVLIVNSINASKESRNKLIATSLAREAVEIARNMRDSNWVTTAQRTCDAGLYAGYACDGDTFCGLGNTCAAGTWDAGLVGVNPAVPVITGSDPYTFDFSATDFSDAIARVRLQNHFYRQGSGVTGAPTEFYRLVFINPICHDAAGTEFIVDRASNDVCGAGSAIGYDDTVGYRVISEVRWGSTSGRRVTIEDRIYNWPTL